MNNLVISVSLDSSIGLLESYADMILLDKNELANIATTYDTVYIRSHFGHPSMSPQTYRNKIEDILDKAKRSNSKVKFIDGMDNVDALVSFEDKWQQYKLFGKFMPRTVLYTDDTDSSTFSYPVYKKRLSSRGNGVTWNQEEAEPWTKEWVVQESLDIAEELRIYVICDEVYDVGAVRRNKTSQQNTQVISTRKLLQNEIDFSLSIMAKAPELDFVGLDIARAADRSLVLLEANRSPGFAKFSELSGVNLASVLYKNISN